MRENTHTIGLRKAAALLCVAAGIAAIHTATGQTDSLRNALAESERDSVEVRTLLHLAETTLPDSAGLALEYAGRAVELSRRVGNDQWLGKSFAALGHVLTRIGELDSARSVYRQSIRHFSAIGDSASIAEDHWRLGIVESMRGSYALAIERTLSALRYYRRTGDTSGSVRSMLQLGLYHQRSKQTGRALEYLRRAETLLPDEPSTEKHMKLYGALGLCYQDMAEDRRAIHYFKRAMKARNAIGGNDYRGTYHRNIAQSYLNLGAYDSAEVFSDAALRISEKNLMPQDIVASIIVLAKTRFAKAEYRSALNALSGALPLARRIGADAEIHEALDLLSRIHAKLRNYKKAFEYAEEAAAYKDTLYSAETIARISQIEDRYERERRLAEQRIREALQEQQLSSANTMRNIAIIGLVLVIILAGVIYNRYRYGQKTARKLQRANRELKQTQEQLLKSQQLASLGQLTAGIAHEIKNPLNFINNFSSLSREMSDELEAALKKEGVHGADDIAELLDNLKTNLAKIEEHGDRADRIVKTMMLHARKGGREKQPVRINESVGDAVDLAWHSARAEGLEIPLEIEKDFGEDAGEVYVLPQEISRAVLNLVQNAIHAVEERAGNSGGDYRPRVTVKTRRTGDTVIVKCIDNGTGIPEDIRGEVFTPFVTSKPIGVGTGLGLSLAFDIVVQQHHGTLTFESAEGEGTEFTMTLPAGEEEV